MNLLEGKVQKKAKMELMFKLVLILRSLKTWQDSQFSQQIPNLFYLNIFQEKFGINSRILRMLMDSLSRKQSSLVVKMLTLESEFMLEVMIPILLLQLWLIQSLNNIMATRRVLFILVTWILINLIVHPSQKKMLKWSEVLEFVLAVILLSSHLLRVSQRNREMTSRKKLLQHAPCSAVISKENIILLEEWPQRNKNN